MGYRALFWCVEDVDRFIHSMSCQASNVRCRRTSARELEVDMMDYQTPWKVQKTMKKPLLLLLMTCLVVGIVGHLIIAFVITG